MVVLFIVSMILVCIIADYFVQRRQTRLAENVSTEKITEKPLSVLNNNPDFNLPEGVFVSLGHLWNLLLPSGKFKIGIDQFVTKTLGPVDKITLAQQGQKVEKGDTLITLSQGDKVLTFKSPVNGIIEYVNQELLDNPKYLKSSSLNKAWALEIKPQNVLQYIKSMYIADIAREWMMSEMKRLKEFLNQVAAQNELVPMAQDGGLPIEGVMQKMDKDAWNMFESEFLSQSGLKVEGS
ncbi:glycine cleavage system protein H [candidate division KSB1 bacterium]|nr:glycine cleavage system protein H [candidate division KSB1 bacterium]